MEPTIYIIQQTKINKKYKKKTNSHKQQNCTCVSTTVDKKKEGITNHS